MDSSWTVGYIQRQRQYPERWLEIVSGAATWSKSEAPQGVTNIHHHQNTSPTESHPMHFGAHAQTTANVRGIPIFCGHSNANYAICDYGARKYLG